MKVILAVNAGSSSVKLSAYTQSGVESPAEIAHAEVSKLGSEDACLEYARQGEHVRDEEAGKAGGSHETAFQEMVDLLVQDPKLCQIQDRTDIDMICHRIVHGGDYQDCQVITAQMYRQLEDLVDLAPLHNGSAMEIVRCCFRVLPKCENVACFDTQFHKTIPRHISTYPIKASRNSLHKYGFHGLSYAFMVRQAAHYLGKDPGALNMIALHLGSGASACAIKNGCSRDTSMGLTPVSGLPGATRSGSIDPSLVFHYTNSAAELSPSLSSSSTKGLHISRAEEILNTESGWAALAGTRDFAAIAASKDVEKKLAFDLFVDRICGFVGSYYVSLRGTVDALVFAGGIGEKSPRLRSAVVEGVACLGFSLDKNANLQKMSQTIEEITGPNAQHRILVCQTDEQLEMVSLCSKRSGA
ncbi:hypothetical protein MY3296_009994 [Beauveria thailandica]